MTVADLKAYFAGGRVVKLAREGYEEPITIPKSDAQVVEQAAHDAVKAGTLWLTSGPTTLLMEDIPPGVLTDVATLQAPPPAISPNKILPDELAAAWTEGTTTARTVADALSDQGNKTLPWVTVRNAIDAAIHARLVERTPESGPWVCDISGASQVKRPTSFFKIAALGKGGNSVSLRLSALLGLHRLAKAVALAVHLEDLAMMRQAVQKCRGHPLALEDLVPLAERQVARHQQAACL